MTETGAIIRFRLGRAREALEEASLLADTGHWNACVNRLYYSCFYAVSALLAVEALSASKHTGVRSLFHQRCVRTGRFPRELGALYDDLFETRQEGDYVDFVELREADVRPWIDQARDFVNRAAGLLP